MAFAKYLTGKKEKMDFIVRAEDKTKAIDIATVTWQNDRNINGRVEDRL